jgi:hypothetical protein
MSYDFNSVTSVFGNLLQLQLVGNYIYGSNDIGNTVSLYRYDINSGSLSSPIITNIPSNISIVVNGNDIYTGTINSKIVKSDISNNTFITYTGTLPDIWSGLIYVSNKLIGIIDGVQNIYYTITLIDGSPNGTYSYVETIFTTSGNNNVGGIAYSTDDVNYIYILQVDGYINKINLPTNSSISEINLNTLLGININGNNNNTYGLAILDNYLCFGLNKSSTYTIYVLDITNFSTPSKYNQYMAPSIIKSIVAYNTGIDFDIYYCYNDGDLYKSTNGFCFNEGTKILCLNQQLADKYIAIELLRIGDFVKTFKHGYRRVSKVIQGSFRNNPKKWNMCMYKMAKTPTNGLIEDLIVTGGHSILVDAISEEEQKKYDAIKIPDFSKLTIDNKHLLLSCCSDQFTPMQDNNKYNYYHLLLENNNDEEERFGIWANGVLTETPNVKTVK